MSQDKCIRGLSGVLALPIIFSGASLFAANIQWLNPNGGAFEDGSNWDGGVPGAADAVIFNLNVDYTVTLGEDQTNERLQIGAGDVTLDLGGNTYTTLAAWDSMNVSPGGHLTLLGPGTLVTEKVSADKITIGQDVNWTSDAITSKHVRVEAGATVNTRERIVNNLTVTGAGSSWKSVYNKNFTPKADTYVTIEDGGLVDTSNSGLGGADPDGFVDFVTVRGLNSTWKTNLLSVGNYGTGLLTIAEGGQVESMMSTLGNFKPVMGQSGGFVFVTGENSTWRITQQLLVGNQGFGVLEISDGGKVYSNRGGIGRGLDGNGVVYVMGEGSAWEMNENLGISSDLARPGSLTIEDGGLVHVGEKLTIYSAGTLNLNGGTLRINSYSNSGTLNYTGGTLQLGGHRTIGADAAIADFFGGSPIVDEGFGLVLEGAGRLDTDMTVAGGEFISQSNLFVGANEAGTLRVEDGGRVSHVSGIIGTFDAEGMVTVTGERSLWTSSDTLVVGQSEAGMLTIADGGRVHVGDLLEIGNNGTINLDGGTLRFDGYDNEGTVNYASGTVQLAGDRTIGSDAAVVDFFGNPPVVGDGFALIVEGDARVETDMAVTGGSLTGQQRIVVGETGAGGLTIADEGVVASDFAVIASAGGSTGSVSITGDGSIWTNAQMLLIGRLGSGTLLVADGGRMMNKGMGIIGDSSTGVGEASVIGEDAVLRVDRDLQVGNVGMGTLAVADGGLVQVGETLYAGSSGTGTLEIGNGGSLHIEKALMIGVAGTVELHGGTLRFDGYANNGRINYTGGTIQLAGARDIGTDAAIADFFGASPTIGDSMALMIEGDGWLAGNTVTVGTGGMMGVGDVLMVASHGAVALDGGMIDGHTIIGLDGVLSGFGGIDGDLRIQTGGELKPSHRAGASAGGVMQVGGDFLLESGATLQVDLQSGQGIVQSDRIEVAGQATLSEESAIRVSTPKEDVQAGDAFTIITATGGVIDEGATLIHPARLIMESAIDGSDYVLMVEIAPRDVQYADLAAKSMNPSIGRAMDQVAQAAEGNHSPASGLADIFADFTQEQLELYIQQVNNGARTTDVTLTMISDSARMQSNVQADYLRGRRAGGVLSNAQQVSSSQQGGGLMFASVGHDPALLAAALDETEAGNVGQAASRFGDEEDRWSVFVRGFSLFGEQDSSSSRTGYRSDAYGIHGGVDYALTPELLAGVSLAYTRSDARLRRGLGAIDADTIRVGPYLSYYRDNWYIDASTTFGYSSFDTDRNSLAGTADASYKSYDATAYLGAGYDFKVGDDLTLTPIASLHYMHLDRRGYDESGVDALTVAAHRTNTLHSRIGARLTHRGELGGMRLVTELVAGWEHEYLRDNDDIHARFTAGSDPFRINTASQAADSAFFGAGVTGLLRDDLSVFVRYDGTADNRGVIHGVSGGLALRF